MTSFMDFMYNVLHCDRYAMAMVYVTKNGGDDEQKALKFSKFYNK